MGDLGISNHEQFRPGRVYGLTHDFGGQPIVRVPRTVKVGIGMPKGRGLHVFINRSGQWCIACEDDPKNAHHFGTQQECREAFAKMRKDAPERKYPRKLAYFTFTRIDSEGLFEPEWEAIEAHGPFPTEIDVVFVNDEPLTAAYQMWTAAEMKCEGDGIHARRVLSMARTPAEIALAKTAAEAGERYFPILAGCKERGCPFPKEGERNGKPVPAACKPHGRLLFQLLEAPRLGGTATFDTTSYRSISQLFSAIQVFRSVTGHGEAERGYVAGIPLKLILRPFKHSRGTSYAVSLEFRASSAVELQRQLMTHAEEYRTAAAATPVATLPAPTATAWQGEEELVETFEPPLPEEAEGAMMEAEFYPDETEEAAEDFSDPGRQTAAERITAQEEHFDLIPTDLQNRFREMMGPMYQRDAAESLRTVNEGLRVDAAKNDAVDLRELAELRLSILLTAAKKERTKKDRGAGNL